MNKIKCTAVGPMGLFLLIGTAYPLLSNAQQSPTGDEALGIEEIIVTGQKRSEKFQDIPKQVAVASNSDLKSAGVDHHCCSDRNVFWGLVRDKFPIHR